MYYHEIRLSYKIHAPILTIYASDIWTFSRNRITVNLVWKTQKSNLELPSCSFAILRCSFTKFGILFIPQYITIILCSFFLVLITFLPWHIIMHVFEVFFPLIVTKPVQTQFWCYFQLTVGTYWSAHGFQKLSIWRTCKQTTSVFDRALHPMMDLISDWKNKKCRNLAPKSFKSNIHRKQHVCSGR